MFARVIGKAAARIDSELHSSGRPIVKYTPSQTAWVLRLTNAAKRGHAAEVQQMCDELAEGFSLDMHDSKGRTALHWAAMKNKANVAYILLDYGASADAERGADGATPLFLAAEVGAKDAAYALLEYEADPDAQRSTDGATPVYIASSNGHLDVVNHLVEFEADVNVTQFSDIRSPPDATAIVKRTGFKPSGSPKKSSSYGIFQKGDKVEVLVGRAREAHWMPGSVTAVYVPTRTNVGHCDMRLIVLGDVEDEDQARRHGMHAHDSKSFEVLKAEDHSEGKGDLTGKHVPLMYVHAMEERVRYGEHCHSVGRRSGWEMAGNSPLIVAAVKNNVSCVKALLRAGASTEFCNKHGKCAGDYLRDLYFLDIDTLLRDRDLWK